MKAEYLKREVIKEFEELPKNQHLPKIFGEFHVDFGDIVIRDKEYPNFIIAVYKFDNIYLNQSRIKPKLLKEILNLLEL